MTRRIALHRWDALPLDKVTEMVARKAISTSRSTLSQTYLKKGAVVPLHAHPGETVIYVLQGALRLHVDADEYTLREGDVAVLPAGVPHQTESLDDTFVMTVE